MPRGPGLRAILAAAKELGVLLIKDRPKFKALTSVGARAAYRKGATVADLGALYDNDGAALKAFTSDKARIAYREGKASFVDLRDLYNKPEMFWHKKPFHDEIDILISDNARILYREGKATFTELKNLYESYPVENRGPFRDMIKALSSPEAQIIYRDGKATFADLKGLYVQDPPAQFKALTSPEAQEIYHEGKATFADLKGLYVQDPAQFKALTSKEARILYHDGKASFAELKALYDADKTPNKSKFGWRVEALSSPEAQTVYQFGNLSFADLKAWFDADETHLRAEFYDKIAALASPEARIIYEQGKGSVAALKAMWEADWGSKSKDRFKAEITALSSVAAQALYGVGVSFEQLKGLYEAKVSPQDLRDLCLDDEGQVADREQFDALTSDVARIIYSKGRETIATLKNLYEAKGKDQFRVEIKNLSSAEVPVSHSAGGFFEPPKALSEVGIPSYLKGLNDVDKSLFQKLYNTLGAREFFSSVDTQALYKAGVSLEQLGVLYKAGAKPEEVISWYKADKSRNRAQFKSEIEALTSDDAQALYNAKISFEQLRVLYKAGASPAEVRDLYKDLLTWEKQKGQAEIAALASPEAQALYGVGVSFKQLKILYDAKATPETMKNFYDQNKEQFTALVSDEAQALYAARVSFGQLRVLYEAGARPADFKTLRDRNFVINALSSIEAQDLYDAGVTFEQLRVLYEAGAFPKELKGCYGVSTFGENISVGKEQFLAEIKALSSTEAQIAYRKGKALFVDLRLLYDLHRDQFNAITSDDARVLYEVGVSFKQLKILYEVGAPPAELNTMYVADLISNKTKVANEIVALTSDDAQALYKAGAPFKQLKTLYESGVSPADLNTMYAADLISNKTKVANEIAAITSADGQVLYKAGVSFKQLRVLYEANVPFAGLSALYKTDIKKFKALISEEAVKAYKAGESFETLSNRYDPDKGLQPETIRENKGFLQWIMKAQRKIGKNRQQAAQEERRRGL